MIIGTNNTIDSYRLETSSNKEEYGSSATLNTIPVYIEQADPRIAIMIDDRHAFETYNMHIDGEPDIEISDKIIDQDGTVYIVNGKQAFTNNEDVDNHTEVTMYKKFTP